jgi:Protein of unknown function (DUF4232)
MTMTPPREDILDHVTDPLELLIKEARRRALRRRLTYGAGLITTVAALLVAAAMGGYGSPLRANAGRSSFARASALAATPCLASAVTVTLEGTDGAAGTLTQLFLVRNGSGYACSLTGYPTVSFISATGATVAQVMTHTRSQGGVLGLSRAGTLPRVNLAAHGGVASFWLASHDVPVGVRPAPCVTIARVSVAWPSASGARQVTLGRFHQFMSCGHANVFPVLAGIYGAQPHRSLQFYFGTAGPNNPNHGSFPTAKSA